MKKHFYFLLLAALVCFLSLSVTSCKDDDKNNDESGEEFTDGPQAEQNEATTKFWSVVGELVGMDEFTENYKDGPFEPIIGEEDPDNGRPGGSRVRPRDHGPPPPAPGRRRHDGDRPRHGMGLRIRQYLAEHEAHGARGSRR